MQPYLKLVADGVFHSYIFFQLFEDIRVSVRRRFVIKPRGEKKKRFCLIEYGELWAVFLVVQ